MLGRRLLLLPDFRISNGDGRERPFETFLADFNILVIRRVPMPSHGPATRLLRRLLAEHRGVADVTVRGFDIRSPDRPCQDCNTAHVVFQEEELMTVCDGNGSIYEQFGVVGDERLFVVRSDRRVMDVGSVRDVGRLGLRSGPEAALLQHHAERSQTNIDGRFESQRASN